MKCDIIIPVWDELDITKNCISNIIRNTVFPYRLIIIDNGSGSEVYDYLQSLKKEMAGLTIIRNEENLGYIKAINQGLKISSSEFVCLLNNDTIVCRGWLSEMVDVAVNNYEVGMVNPSSNTLAQSVPKGETLDTYAQSLKERFKGQWGQLGQCSGFCMLIKREVIENIGIFDEAYTVGYFEEADYCRRAQRKGYEFARAKGAYVYHLDRVSFAKRSDKEELFVKNRKIFESHWGKSLRIACIISKPPKDAIDRDEVGQIISTTARDNHQIYVYIRKNLISKFNIVEHSNILIFGFNNIFFPLICLSKIITKKKKFAIISTDGIILFYILKILAFIHKAKLMFNPHLERAIELSQQQAFQK